MHIGFLLQTAFSLFMLYDAVNRRAERYWWVIVMVPFGEWVYFFAVYVHTPEFRNLIRPVWHSRPSLAKLEYEARLCASFHNRFRLGEALLQAGRAEDAAALFQELWGEDSDCLDALYKLALCQLELGQAETGIKNLRRLLRKGISYADYEAAEALAQALWRSDKKEECISFLRDLARQSHRSVHKCCLAKILAKEGNVGEARDILDELIEGHRHAPSHIRRGNRAWLGDAKRLRRSLA